MEPFGVICEGIHKLVHFDLEVIRGFIFFQISWNQRLFLLYPAKAGKEGIAEQYHLVLMILRLVLTISERSCRHKSQLVSQFHRDFQCEESHFPLPKSQFHAIPALF